MLGHEDHIMGVSALSRERVVTAGGKDRTIRMWKVTEESQLVSGYSNTVIIASDISQVFNGPSTCLSMECVAMLNEDHFVSGSSDG